ncbi:MAG: hypothetical protein FJW23_10000 [Acidimicrobiia bacterium]|nr:hypothetical protein [Acidimicrobiia bacterium]
MAGLAAARNLTLKQARRARNRARYTWKVCFEAVKDAVHAVGRVREGASNTAINAGKDAYRAVRRPVRLVRQRRAELREQRSWNRIEWGVERELDRLLDGDGPIIVGPWLGEVGYEVLYWIPFLRWVSASYGVDPNRVVAVSRGGVASWYADVAAAYEEVWDHVDPAVFAEQHVASAKQILPSRLEADLVTETARVHGVSGARVLRPELMFRLFRLFWSGHRATGFLDVHTRFRLHRPPGVVRRTDLPDDYIAVKFYAARSLPDTPAIRRRLQRMVAELAEQAPVVLLDTGLTVDDHTDHPLDVSGGVMSARHLLEPRTNLGAQTDIIANARAYVGTCGSLTWLAPLLGVRTAAVLADPEFLHAHLAVALRACHRLDGAGEFCPLDLRALDLLP